MFMDLRKAYMLCFLGFLMLLPLQRVEDFQKPELPIKLYGAGLLYYGHIGQEFADSPPEA